jgi:hypothetical protein
MIKKTATQMKMWNIIKHGYLRTVQLEDLRKWKELISGTFLCCFLYIAVQESLAGFRRLWK